MGIMPQNNGPTVRQYSQTYGGDGPLMYWMDQLDEHRRTEKSIVFGICNKHLNFMVQLFLATHLATSKLIEDCRNGLPGDQVKLIPTPPNHPSRKFRVIQLWARDGKTTQAKQNTGGKTVLTPFFDQDVKASNKRRRQSPLRKSTSLKIDLVQEARKSREEYQQLLREVKEHQAQQPEWCRGGDDGLDPSPNETAEAFKMRVRSVLHQRW